MTVATLLHATDPLASDATVADALVEMAEVHLAHLPVVSASGQLEGVVGETALRAWTDPDARLASLPTAPPVTVGLETHVFDAAHLLRQHDLTMLPVVGADGHYEGLVVRSDVFGQLAHMLATEEPGAIVVLDVSRRDFSLGQLAHLVEQNGVRILSVSTEDDPGAGRVRVTLKLNVTDTARVRHMMEHYGYPVAAVFDEAADDLQERAEAFLRYLDV